MLKKCNLTKLLVLCMRKGTYSKVTIVREKNTGNEFIQNDQGNIRNFVIGKMEVREFGNESLWLSFQYIQTLGKEREKKKSIYTDSGEREKKKKEIAHAQKYLLSSSLEGYF